MYLAITFAIGGIILCIAVIASLAKYKVKLDEQQGIDPSTYQPSKTFNCPICGKEVSKTAKTCPNCGHDFVGISNKIFKIVGIIILVFVVGAIILSIVKIQISFSPS